MKIRSKLEMTTRDAGVYTAAFAKKVLAKSADLVAALPASTRGAIKAASTLTVRAEPLVEAQLETLEVAATLGAKRLKTASEAESFDGLVKGQVALFPETKAAALAESRKYLTMFFATKGKVDEAIEAKVMSWVAPKPTKARKAVAQPATPVVEAAA